jgi:hypothetical protein
MGNTTGIRYNNAGLESVMITEVCKNKYLGRFVDLMWSFCFLLEGKLLTATLEVFNFLELDVFAFEDDYASFTALQPSY